MKKRLENQAFFFLKYDTWEKSRHFPGRGQQIAGTAGRFVKKAMDHIGTAFILL